MNMDHEYLAVQRDELRAALKDTLDALINETYGKVDTHWIQTVKSKARTVLHETSNPTRQDSTTAQP